TYIAQLVSNKGFIVATDPVSKRLSRLRENCDRLGVACEIRENLHPGELFDRVLVDVPCSNTGVLRRRVDLRWRISPRDLKRFQKTQLEILLQAAKFVKPGGVLVYSTCSLEPEENQQVTQLFASKTPEMIPGEERILTPFADGVDGAYVAKFVRKC
ncbi:MAG: RsmB/NOP family class I SAM-dependent RNA methyltransferase, partial [Verrucomicrobiae bacterium]|nr:RsmB/NOP family class I SAM-dependent RNA methyltransferase [Verrucomicrobiae bacterium]